MMFAIFLYFTYRFVAMSQLACFLLTFAPFTKSLCTLQWARS